ncbi:MAG: hypothetical protein HXY26_04970 [Hydrogenophilaceae bacterium]|nr:hypothetical protein [Hydrogenophilaceae bacterium]
MRQAAGGILFSANDRAELDRAGAAFRDLLAARGLAAEVESVAGPDGLRFFLKPAAAAAWAPDYDTLQLCEKLGLDGVARPDDLEREILIAMLLGPVAFEFPSYAELLAAVRMRRYIVEAARQTELDFHTTEAERPAEYWTYAEGRGFIILPGKPLITALQKATQPEVSGELYSFSCYRATEYVILLGIAQELQASNPELLARLQRQWEQAPIMSGRFHDVFLREYGSMEDPLPMKYYVPGDRLWFRNPDEASSDVVGYEGSWVFYLGGGLFTNFWKRGKPFTLASKCLEIYHWRHGTYRDAAGELQMDEARVEAHVRASQADPAEAARIVERMLRYRDPKGVYRDGGCIDTSREYPRWVCPGTSDMPLPER